MKNRGQADRHTEVNGLFKIRGVIGADGFFLRAVQYGVERATKQSGNKKFRIRDSNPGCVRERHA